MSRHGLRHRSPVISVAALGLMLGACGSASHRAEPPSSGPPTSAVAVSPSTTSLPTMLPAGQVGRRSDVPWSLVGPGWLLAEWAPTAAQHSADMTMGNPAGTVLFLVDPEGGRYVVASGPSVPLGDLASWSGDGKRALFQARLGGGADLRLTVLDTTNGSKTSFPVPTTGSSPIFTEPAGLAVLTGAGNEVPARRYSLEGVLQLTFPTSYDVSGQVRGGRYSPDGGELAFDTDRAAIALVGNDGRLIRFLPIPTSGLCTTLRWWSADQILAVCGSSAEPSLWLIPSDGRSPRLLGPGHSAWPLSTGTYSATGGCHMDVCLFGLLALEPGGSSEAVTVPVPWRYQNVSPLGGFESRLAIFGGPVPPSGVGTQPGFLDWFDPQTGAVTALLGGSVNGGSVNDALMY